MGKGIGTRSRAASSTPASSSERVGALHAQVRSQPLASDAVEPEALVVTHWFDAGDDGDAYSATIRLRGQRVGIRGRPKPGETFAQEDRIERIVPGSGRVSISAWVYGLAPGDWNVTGDLVRPRQHTRWHRGSDRGQRFSTEPLHQAAWSWRRWTVSTIPAATMSTRWALPAPLAWIPAVIPGSWPLLGTVAIAVAFITQAAILARENLPVGESLVVSLLAVAFGLVGAKVWYAVLHPGPWRRAILGGWAVDGFLAVCFAVGVAALLAFHLPVGAVLDATAPGLFFAVAIGRIGCFLTGCCAGRCTSSRWGVWSSDRRVGARRIPAQLLESGAGLLIGVVAGFLVLGDAPGIDGLVFVASFGAYIVVRQLLLRLRAERREYSWRQSHLVPGERA